MENDLKKMKNGRWPQKKWKMEDNLNFKAVLLSWFNNKNLKTNGFDTIEIDLVYFVLAFCKITFNFQVIIFEFWDNKIQYPFVWKKNKNER